MSRTIYALLIGIDDYPESDPEASRLCQRHRCLRLVPVRTCGQGQRHREFKLKTLKKGEATRQAVVDAFSNHLGKAKKGDVALFYYSGHGSQEQAPEEFWKLEPDHLDMTLVLFDSRSPGSWDLADKEIAKLIADVAAKGPHVAVILDCCHSGSGTREIETVVRRGPTDFRRRPIESFLVSAAEAEAASASRSVTAKDASRHTPPEGRGVVLPRGLPAVVGSGQEYGGDGDHRGAFSFFLGESLKSAGACQPIATCSPERQTGSSGQVSNQSPQLEATQNDDLDATFLDRAVRNRRLACPGFSTPHRRGHSDHRRRGGPGPGRGLRLDAAGHALYPFDAPAALLCDPAKAVAMARVEDVLPATSRLAIENKVALDPKATYKAIIVSLPTPPLHVLLDGDAASWGLVRQALESASPEGKPSLFIAEAAKRDSPTSASSPATVSS